MMVHEKTVKEQCRNSELMGYGSNSAIRLKRLNLPRQKIYASYLHCLVTTCSKALFTPNVFVCVFVKNHDRFFGKKVIVFIL